MLFFGTSLSSIYTLFRHHSVYFLVPTFLAGSMIPIFIGVVFSGSIICLVAAVLVEEDIVTALVDEMEVEAEIVAEEEVRMAVDPVTKVESVTEDEALVLLEIWQQATVADVEERRFYLRDRLKLDV